MSGIYKSGNWYGGGSGGSVDVDDTLSSSSENPVQNKVIKDALDGKVDSVSSKGLSTNDYDDTEKAKVAAAVSKAVNDLVNYYTKTETYSKTEVDAIITAVKNSRFKAVEELPTENIETNVIYLVPAPTTRARNRKEEYINTDGTSEGWESLGNTSINLSGYVTTEALNAALADYVTSTDLTALLKAKQDKMQYDTMPAASVDILGKIVQYIGDTTSDYINGHFYKCVPSGASEGNTIEIPKQTGPSDKVKANSVYGSGYEAWLAFDKDSNTVWATTVGSSSNYWISYEFDIPITPVKWQWMCDTYGGAPHASDMSLQASNDEVNWTTLDRIKVSDGTIPNDNNLHTREVTINEAYKYYRAYIHSVPNSWNGSLKEFNVIGTYGFKWQNISIDEVPTDIADLTDNTNIIPLEITDLSDIQVGSLTDNDVLAWDSQEGKFVNQPQSSGSSSSSRTIQDYENTDMTARTNLQFGESLSVTDDSENDATVVDEYELTDADIEEILSELPSPLSGSNKGCIPCGKVEAFYREAAPDGYLVCDGTEYAKADYPKLASILLGLTEHTQYEGSDSDHFKVPDLRGEFLRGSGTNSRTNQGSGGNVGEHQDGTLFGTGNLGDNNSNFYEVVNEINNNKYDFKFSNSQSTGIPRSRNGSQAMDYGGSLYTSKPTNTSVLFCIAYKDIFLTTELPVLFDETDKEYPVGKYVRTDGKWKPVYRKFYSIQPITINTTWTSTNILREDIERMLYSRMYNTNGAFNCECAMIDNYINLETTRHDGIINNIINFIIEYTKTNDEWR